MLILLFADSATCWHHGVRHDGFSELMAGVFFEAAGALARNRCRLRVVAGKPSVEVRFIFEVE
jgi:hypothetical protein